MHLFGKSNPNEQLRKMTSAIRREKYKVQRDIAALKNSNEKVVKDIKKRAQCGSLDEAKILAKELVNSRKAVAKLYAANAHMDCIISELNVQAAAVRMAGCLQVSTSVMKSMSALVKLPELNKTMQGMSKEMMKMGLIGEMIDDTMESALGDTDTDTVSSEVEKILHEITAGEIAKAPNAVEDSVPAGTPVAGVSRHEVAEVEDGPSSDVSEMQARLAALRN